MASIKCRERCDAAFSSRLPASKEKKRKNAGAAPPDFSVGQWRAALHQKKKMAKQEKVEGARVRAKGGEITDCRYLSYSRDLRSLPSYSRGLTSPDLGIQRELVTRA